MDNWWNGLCWCYSIVVEEKGLKYMRAYRYPLEMYYSHVGYGQVPYMAGYGTELPPSPPNTTVTTTSSSATTAEEDDYMAYVQQYFPMMFQALYGKSDEEKLATLRAKLKTLQNLKKATPSLAIMYDPQIEKLKGLIQVLEQRADSEKETRTYLSAMKWISAIGAIGIGGSLMYFLIKRA